MFLEYNPLPFFIVIGAATLITLVILVWIYKVLQRKGFSNLKAVNLTFLTAVGLCTLIWLLLFSANELNLDSGVIFEALFLFSFGLFQLLILFVLPSLVILNLLVYIKQNR